MSGNETMTGHLLPAAGLLLGPAAWALNTQLGQVLPHVDCGTGTRLSLYASMVCVMLSTIGAVASARALRAPGGTAALPSAGPRRVPAFLAVVSTLSGALFTFALLLQTAASTVLDGCLR